MMKMKSKYLKLLIFLFILNSITFALYFSSHPNHNKQNPHHQIPQFDHTHSIVSFSNSNNNQPWPILPSYLPWSLSNTPAFRSCESYFGNGFTRRVDVLKPEKGIRKMGHGGQGGGGWFRCFFSETLRSSICEGGGIRMHPDKIRMSNGGEVLESVIGRGEDEELPQFEFGAFDIASGGGKVKKGGEKLADEAFLNEYLQNGAVSRHAMRDLVNSVKLVGADQFECAEVECVELRDSDPCDNSMSWSIVAPLYDNRAYWSWVFLVRGWGGMGGKKASGELECSTMSGEEGGGYVAVVHGVTWGDRMAVERWGLWWLGFRTGVWGVAVKGSPGTSFASFSSGCVGLAWSIVCVLMLVGVARHFGLVLLGFLVSIGKWDEGWIYTAPIGGMQAVAFEEVVELAHTDELNVRIRAVSGARLRGLLGVSVFAGGSRYAAQCGVYDAFNCCVRAVCGVVWLGMGHYCSVLDWGVGLGGGRVQDGSFSDDWVRLFMNSSLDVIIRASSDFHSVSSSDSLFFLFSARYYYQIILLSILPVLFSRHLERRRYPMTSCMHYSLVSELFVSCTSAGLSRKRRRSSMTSVPALPLVSGALSSVRADLIPSPKRVRDSGYLADVEVDPREISLRDDAIVRVSDEPLLEQDINPEIQAEIDECIAYADALRDRGIADKVVVVAVDRDETETSVRGLVEVRVERVTHPAMPEDILEPAQEGAVEVTYETLGDLVQRFHDHTQAIPVHHIQAIEGVQREQGHRIIGVESAVTALTERVAELERDNRRRRGTMPSTRSGASMTREEFEELVTRRVAEEMEAREAARTLEPLNENGDELEGENGGNGNGGNRGNGNGGNGNGNGGNGDGNRGNGNGNGGNGNGGNGGNGNGGNGNRNGNHGMNHGGFMP
ncbi:hypothetical protein Tco_0651094, partial [Tanacetum coccineum]